jgi:hypothetical protein
VTSLNLGTEDKRLGLLRSRPDPFGRVPMRGGPSLRIVDETVLLHETRESQRREQPLAAAGGARCLAGRI